MIVGGIVAIAAFNIAVKSWFFLINLIRTVNF